MVTPHSKQKERTSPWLCFPNFHFIVSGLWSEGQMEQKKAVRLAINFSGYLLFFSMQQNINAVSDWTCSSKGQSGRQSGRHRVAVQSADAASSPSRTTLWFSKSYSQVRASTPLSQQHLQPPAGSWAPLKSWDREKTNWRELKGSSLGAKLDKDRALNFFFCFRFSPMLGVSFTYYQPYDPRLH